MLRNKLMQFLWWLSHIDIFFIFIYIFFPSEILILLLSVFDAIIQSIDFLRYRFFVWGCFLFFICAVASFLREMVFVKSMNSSMGAMLIDLMILSAFFLAASKLFFGSAMINPMEIINLGIVEYFFAIFWTAMAGYALADISYRFFRFLSK